MKSFVRRAPQTKNTPEKEPKAPPLTREPVTKSQIKKREKQAGLQKGKRQNL